MTLRDISDWLLITAEGKQWLGRPPPGWKEAVYQAEEQARPLTVVLDPIFEYALIMAQGPDGSPRVIPNLKPPFGMMSIRTLRIPAPIWIAVGALARDEQNSLGALLTMTEDAIRQARAEAAGISLVGAGAKLPPPPAPGRR